MRKLITIASLAALAAAMPALAKPGDKDNGKGGSQAAAHQSQGGGHGQGNKGVKHDRAQHANQGARAGGDRSDRGPDKVKYDKVERHAVRNEVRREERSDRRGYEDRGSNRGERFVDDRIRERDRYLAGSQNCPPGLAKKHNGCLPPGQAKRGFTVGQHIQPAWFSGYSLPASYRDIYQDSDEYFYRYNNDGNIYRVDSRSNLITALIPLLGGGFSVGQQLPAGFGAYNLPVQYRDDYHDTDEDYYRYGDNAIYRVDSQSNTIESIVALLAGDLNVGQALPSGYDAYNLPMEYRDDYQDSDEDLYRYADGNIYQVDAKTQIIEAIVQALI